LFVLPASISAIRAILQLVSAAHIADVKWLIESYRFQVLKSSADSAQCLVNNVVSRVNKLIGATAAEKRFQGFSFIRDGYETA